MSARHASGIGVIAAAVALTTAAAPMSVPEPLLLWQVSYDGGAGHHDYGIQLVTTRNAIYVAASTQDREHPEDFTLLRYALDGQLRWERHYGGTTDRAGEPSDLAVAPGGGVVVTGLTRNADGGRVTTVRYGPNGQVRWARERTLVGPFFSADGPRLAVAVDGSVRVSATTAGDFLVLAYAADGARQWSTRIDGSAGDDDVATDVAVDLVGNTYVAGPAGGGFGGFSTAKLDAAGDVEWVHNVHGPFGATLGPAFVEVARDGSAVVSAVPESSCGVFQSRTWKLAPDGSEEWQTAYPPQPCDSMEAVGMRVRSDGSVVVLGTELSGSDYQFATLSYDASGNPEWARTLDSESTDLATALTVDLAGNTYVTGVGTIGLPDNDAVTASYDRAGQLRWHGRADTGSQSERPAGIAVLADGTVAITGDYWVPERLEDVFTLRYRQPPSPSTG